MWCAACTPCPHGKVKYDRRKCKKARVDPPSSKRIKLEQKSSPEIKLESEIKHEPEPFTIRGYFRFDDEHET